MTSKLILLVEDDNNLRQSFALILERAGYSVTATECAMKALNMVQSGNYQMVISDLNTPATRDELIPKILGTYSNLPLVILTDHSIIDVEKDEKFIGAYYLVKPIAPEILLENVQNIFAIKN